MKIKAFFSVLATVSISLIATAEDSPAATLKALYDYVIHSIKGKLEKKRWKSLEYIRAIVCL